MILKQVSFIGAISKANVFILIGGQWSLETKFPISHHDFL